MFSRKQFATSRQSNDKTVNTKPIQRGLVVTLILETSHAWQLWGHLSSGWGRGPNQSNHKKIWTQPNSHARAWLSPIYWTMSVVAKLTRQKHRQIKCTNYFFLMTNHSASGQHGHCDGGHGHGCLGAGGKDRIFPLVAVLLLSRMTLLVRVVLATSRFFWDE